MGLLFAIGAACCISLVALGAVLGYAVSRRRVRTEFGSFGSVRDRLARVPPAFVHPRLDLASGFVPGHQAVDLERRRNRQQSSNLLRHKLSAAYATGAFQPFGERQKHLKSFRERLDLVYACDAMGDLSDPIAGHIWHLRSQPGQIPS